VLLPRLQRRAFLGGARDAVEQFQEKCETVFPPELRQNKEIERFGVSVKRKTALETLILRMILSEIGSDLRGHAPANR
jgi:hypothetical protein